MSEFGGPESFAPGEEGSGVSEAAREQASQRFAASQQAAKQQQKDEKKAKKRDDGVAQVIMQFLTDTQKTHLATLIARLVARDCPSTFVLAILSLINDRCMQTVEEYLAERDINPETTHVDQSMVPVTAALTADDGERLGNWMIRTDLVLRSDTDAILNALIVDDRNIDGTILQLTSFVLQEFLTARGKNPEFEQLQKLSAGILQSLFTPHMHARMKRRLETEKSENDDQ
jgi:hypothetical protein